jgi:hypothetical protein
LIGGAGLGRAAAAVYRLGHIDRRDTH